ncbi:MAG: DUF4230 domain-containing protein [Acidobacteria bacterium]|nr:DUF4230 domain-containing protein [Acidobacteriota bacterium]
MMQKEPRSGANSKALLIVAVVVGLLVAGSVAALYVVLVKAPTDLASATAEGIKDLFQVTPQVTINQTVVIEQNSPILEVATVSRDMSVDHRWTSAWMGSTKTLELRGTFTAKAGFNLQEPFDIDITRYPLSIDASLPQPAILSLEMRDMEILRDVDGWWNRVTAQDRESAIRALSAAAREQSERSGILEEVAQSAEARVRELVERNGASVAFRYPWDDWED